MLVAGCAQGASNLDELLRHLGVLDARFTEEVKNGLTVFDEHNVRDDTSSIDRLLGESPPGRWPPFRVYNDVTRNASTQPTGAGLVIFNLPARRIIQVQNSYAEILRSDRGRRRENGKPVQQLYHYKLPAEWTLTP